jgi:hypothetical protein
MKLRLSRESFPSNATIGKLYVNGAYECATLEDEDRKLELGGVKVYGRTCIPRGHYDVVITYSNRFKRELPLLMRVPQFDGIRIHPGNTHEDTDGCILLGVLNEKGDRLVMSRTTFNGFYTRLEHAIGRGEAVTMDVE